MAKNSKSSSEPAAAPSAPPMVKGFHEPGFAEVKDEPKHQKALKLKALREREAALKDEIENRIPKYAEQINRDMLIKDRQRALKEVQTEIKQLSNET